MEADKVKEIESKFRRMRRLFKQRQSVQNQIKTQAYQGCVIRRRKGRKDKRLPSLTNAGLDR